MSISIHDVARESSLSCETILETLVTPSALEPEVVRFVMQTIRKSGYLQTFSRWKTGKHNSMVAVLTPSVGSASSSEIFRGIDRAMSSLGLSVSSLVFPTRFSAVLREDILGKLLHFELIAAVITINITPSDEIVRRYSKIGKPLVLMQAGAPGAQSVLLENQKGMSIAVNYLFQKGYRRIALVNGPTGGKEPGSVPSERLMGYVTALHRVGIELDESLVFEASNYEMEEGAKALEHFVVGGKKPPEAVICATGDMSAIGFINAAREKGIRVPEDVAVMGYDDLPVARLFQPGLTTIRQRLMIAGAGALVLALESCINGKGDSLVIMPELVVRGTA